MSVHKPAPPRKPAPLREPANDRNPLVCPVCGAAAHRTAMGSKIGWTCAAGGYAHYYEAQYGHLKRWFTSGEGNLREPVIRAMNCAA